MLKLHTDNASNLHNRFVLGLLSLLVQCGWVASAEYSNLVPYHGHDRTDSEIFGVLHKFLKRNDVFSAGDLIRLLPQIWTNHPVPTPVILAGVDDWKTHLSPALEAISGHKEVFHWRIFRDADCRARLQWRPQGPESPDAWLPKADANGISGAVFVVAERVPTSLFAIRPIGGADRSSAMASLDVFKPKISTEAYVELKQIVQTSSIPYQAVSGSDVATEAMASAAARAAPAAAQAKPTLGRPSRALLDAIGSLGQPAVMRGSLVRFLCFVVEHTIC